MNPAEDFDAFVAIVDAGSVSEAARTLDVPRASLSRQLARLERRLGVRLLHRTTRRLVPTRAGEALYPRARSLVDAAQAAVASVRRLDDVPRGLLRVSAPPVHTPELGVMISEFLAANPEVRLELQSSAEHIDLAGQRIDVALRAGVVRDPSLMCRVLMRTSTDPMASPAYLERRGTPRSVDELAGHTCLRAFMGGLRPASSWPLRGGGEVAVDGPLVCNDLMTLLGAVQAGLGLGLLPRQLVSASIDDGRLVPVLEQAVGLETSICLVWLDREFVDPKVRAFIDFVADWASTGRLFVQPERPPA